MGPETGSSPDLADLGVSYVRHALISSAALMFLIAVLQTAFVLAVFDWDAQELAVGTAIGVVIWGALNFFIKVRERIPKVQPAEPPVGVLEQIAKNERDSNNWALVLLIAIPASIGMAWLADWWDLGAVFVPGQFAGFAFAYLLGAWLVARWEQRRDQLLIVASDEEDEVTLYARPAS